MKTRAAVAYEVNAPWVVEEFEINDPGPEEILVKMSYAGLCHSDEHIRLGDFTDGALPMVCGHEGSGVVQAVGDHVRGFAVGDHVAASFIPSCGRCPSCADGMQYLCDNGAEIMAGTDKFFGPRGPVKAMSGIGTFSEYAVVHENSIVPVGDWYPLEAVSLCSCGVATGWGSAVNVADVRAGDTVVIIGTGGIGVNAVQGAAMAGAANIIAVDPIEMKREFAQTMGATHAVASIEDAAPLVDELSWGRGANSVIITVGDATSDLFAPAMAMVGKGGGLTLTSLSDMMQNEISLNTVDLAMSGKHLHGSIYGYCNPRADIPRLLRLYDQGKLKLDELVTQTYALEDINEGYRALHEGEIIRGLIDFSL
ncbi:MAG: NDMA-dependent alcohol dehydrogenase [Actinomycetota bacterium]